MSPERCGAFHFVSHGPLFAEARDMESHIEPRNKIAALEKGLAEALCEAGYHVLNTVKCKKPVDRDMLSELLVAFAAHFPKLFALSRAKNESAS